MKFTRRRAPPHPRKCLWELRDFPSLKYSHSASVLFGSTFLRSQEIKTPRTGTIEYSYYSWHNTICLCAFLYETFFIDFVLFSIHHECPQPHLSINFGWNVQSSNLMLTVSANWSIKNGRFAENCRIVIWWFQLSISRGIYRRRDEGTKVARLFPPSTTTRWDKSSSMHATCYNESESCCLTADLSAVQSALMHSGLH